MTLQSQCFISNKQEDVCTTKLARKQLLTYPNTVTKGAKCYSHSVGFIVGTAPSPVAEKASLPKQSMSDYQQLETMSFL